MENPDITAEALSEDSPRRRINSGRSRAQYLYFCCNNLIIIDLMGALSVFYRSQVSVNKKD